MKREQDGVAKLRQEAERRDVLCTEAWFMSMAMGHPDASDEDKLTVRKNLEEANSALEIAMQEAEDAARRLEYYEAFLKQCTPSAT